MDLLIFQLILIKKYARLMIVPTSWLCNEDQIEIYIVYQHNNRFSWYGYQSLKTNSEVKMNKLDVYCILSHVLTRQKRQKMQLVFQTQHSGTCKFYTPLSLTKT